MDTLQKIRKKFTIILGVLGVLDLLLLGYLLLPSSSFSALQERDRNLEQQRDTLEKEVKPLRGMSEKLEKTRVDVKTFSQQKIPSSYSEISQQLDKIKQEDGVEITSVRYDPEKTDKGGLPGIQRITIDTMVTGDYTKVAKFINTMEQDNFFFVITQVQLTGREAGLVSLQVKLETFLKETT